MKSLALFALLSLIVASDYKACGTEDVAQKKETLTSYSPCNPALWQRTYGPMERFSYPYDRSTLRHRCVVDVRATLTRMPLDMKDGDVKIWFTVDESNFAPVAPRPAPYNRYTSLNRQEFFPDGVSREIAAEVVCAAKKEILTAGEFAGRSSPVKDPNNRNGILACDNYTDKIYAPWRAKNLKKGSVIFITGELVKDTGPCEVNDGACHNKVEIHPVSIIKD